VLTRRNASRQSAYPSGMYTWAPRRDAEATPESPHGDSGENEEQLSSGPRDGGGRLASGDECHSPGLPFMSVEYMVGAERTKCLQSNAIMAGRRVGDGGQRVPDGPTHAVSVATGATVCGCPADELFVFNTIDWERASLVAKCVECRNGVKA